MQVWGVLVLLNTQATDNVLTPEPDMTVADPQPINMPWTKNIVSIAVTNFG